MSKSFFPEIKIFDWEYLHNKTIRIQVVKNKSIVLVFGLDLLAKQIYGLQECVNMKIKKFDESSINKGYLAAYEGIPIVTGKKFDDLNGKTLEIRIIHEHDWRDVYGVDKEANEAYLIHKYQVKSK